MTTAGILSSWTNKKAVYMTANGPSFVRQYMKIVPKDADAVPGTGLKVIPYAQPAAFANYAQTIAPHGLKIYHYSVPSAGTTKLYWLKQGATVSEELLGGTSGLSFIYPSRFGVFIKYSGGNLYRINEAGVLEQTIYPADLGGGTDDIASRPTYHGQTAGDFAFVSGRGQVCIYRPFITPGQQPERIVILNGYPSQTGYHTDSLVYSPKWNRLYWVGYITGQLPRVMYVTPGSAALVASASFAAPQSYGNSLAIYQGDPICLFSDDCIYRSNDGGATWTLWLNIGLICNAASFRYLATDNISIFVNGISNDTGNSTFYQIDVNQACITYTEPVGYDYDPNDLICGAIV